MNDWQESTLGEICDQVGGAIRTGPFGSQLHKSDYSDKGTPVVMPKDIVSGRISESSIARVDKQHVERLNQHKLYPGDIVYGRRGDIGRCAIITTREAGWLCGTGCLRISLGNQILDPVFLFYYLCQEKVIAYIYNQGVGATMPNLNTDILKKVPVLFPDLETQRRIASVLSAYDDLIENNTRRIAILEEMARLIYQEWFVHFRFPGHEKVKMVESELGPIPEGWEVKRFPELVFFQEGPGLRKWQWTETGMKVINGKNILKDGSVDINNTDRYISLEEFREKYRHFEIQEGDIIVVSSGSYGKIGRILKHHLPLMMNTSVMRFRTKSDELLNNDYLRPLQKAEVRFDQ